MRAMRKLGYAFVLLEFIRSVCVMLWRFLESLIKLSRSVNVPVQGTIIMCEKKKKFSCCINQMLNLRHNDYATKLMAN
jgi:hypothetical protein